MRVSAENAMSRSASTSSSARSGIEARRWTSASRAITGLWQQLVAAGVGHQQLRIGGVAFDLLAQPVDVRLQRVRRHIGVVAPDLAQENLARHRLRAGAIEEAQDRR